MKNEKNAAMFAIARKDMREAMSDKQARATFFIVPAILVTIFPAIFFCLVKFNALEQSNDVTIFLRMLPPQFHMDNLYSMVMYAVLNYMVPSFFLMIPVMSCCVAAGATFVGEKERHTLETLLFSPLSIRRIFASKALGSFALGMLVSFVSFALFAVLVFLGGLWTGVPVMLDPVVWSVTLLGIMPALSLAAISLMIRISAKAKTFQQAQQSSIFLIMPILLLFYGQMGGLFVVSGWGLALVGAIAWVVALVMGRLTMIGIDAEKLLK